MESGCKTSVLEQENQGVSVARNTGLAVASGKYLTFPDIDDKLYPGMYRTLLEMAEKGNLDVATCNGRYVYENEKISTHFPAGPAAVDRRFARPRLVKQALDSRKFLHVTWLNIYRREFIASTLPFRARPASSGYSVDHRSAAGG
jgi:glycosyltransferase involved in cell wall biosynthesis